MILKKHKYAIRIEMVLEKQKYRRIFTQVSDKMLNMNYEQNYMDLNIHRVESSIPTDSVTSPSIHPQ